MYCEKCQALTPENENGCLRCGENARREPQMDDYCFLVEKEMMWGEMLADVLVGLICSNWTMPSS